MAAMEYQHIYCETLPDKIAGASRAIMDGMAPVAEKLPQSKPNSQAVW